MYDHLPVDLIRDGLSRYQDLLRVIIGWKRER